VNTIIRWQIPDKNVGTLYRTYKTNDNIRDQLLHRDLQAAVNVAFANDDPLGAQGDSSNYPPASPASALRAQPRRP
jgi:hypothetical protein